VVSRVAEVAVVGAGYVGLVTGASLALIGHRVTCVDRDGGRVAGLREGRLPFYEPGLEELVARGVGAGRLSFTERLDEAVGLADVAFIAVGTPQGDDGGADLSNVSAVALPEHVLEAPGGDDLEYPARSVAGVPERVPLITGLEDEASCIRVYHLVAELRPRAPLQDVAVLVLVGVAMKRGGERPRGDWVLDEREPSSRLLPPDHEPDAEGSEIHGLAITGPNDARTLQGHPPLPFALQSLLFSHGV